MTAPVAYSLYGPRRSIDLRRAVDDDDYYATVRMSLRGDARRKFEKAVDELWRELHAEAGSS